MSVTLSICAYPNVSLHHVVEYKGAVSPILDGREAGGEERRQRENNNQRFRLSV